MAIGSYKALHIDFGEKLADQWVTLPNRGELFAVQAPIDYMIEHGTAGMKTVRRLLDSGGAPATGELRAEKPPPTKGQS